MFRHPGSRSSRNFIHLLLTQFVIEALGFPAEMRPHDLRGGLVIIVGERFGPTPVLAFIASQRGDRQVDVQPTAYLQNALLQPFEPNEEIDGNLIVDHEDVTIQREFFRRTDEFSESISDYRKRRIGKARPFFRRDLHPEHRHDLVIWISDHTEFQVGSPYFFAEADASQGGQHMMVEEEIVRIIAAPMADDAVFGNDLRRLIRFYIMLRWAAIFFKKYLGGSSGRLDRLQKNEPFAMTTKHVRIRGGGRDALASGAISTI